MVDCLTSSYHWPLVLELGPTIGDNAGRLLAFIDLKVRMASLLFLQNTSVGSFSLASLAG